MADGTLSPTQFRFTKTSLKARIESAGDGACVFRSIRSLVPTTSGQAFRSIRSL
jgi:hypothetical protein